MNEMTVQRTPETVGAEIRDLTVTAKYMTLWYAVEIGRKLTEAKAMVPHGEWMDFLKRETEYSSSAANRMMTLFREYGNEHGANFPTLGNISVSNALRLLAVPEEERETFAAEVDAEHISSRELEEAIKARAEAEKALEKANAEACAAIERAEDAEQTVKEYSEENVRLTDDLAEAERRVKELENRPVEIAVQEPKQEDIDRAVADAMKEAQKQAEQALAAAKAESEALERKLEETRKKLEEAENDAEEEADERDAEREKLSAEVAELRKKIAMSGEELTTFKLRFSAWQEAWGTMQKALDKVPEDQKDKCRAAIRAVVRGWDL